MKIRSKLPLLMLPILSLLAACSPIVVKGKVIRGGLSMAATVPASDERLGDAGIKGVTIEAAQQGRLGEVVTATSRNDGSFSIPLKGNGSLSLPMTVKVTADGYLPAEVTLPTPTPEARLLVVLKPMRRSGE